MSGMQRLLIKLIIHYFIITETQHFPISTPLVVVNTVYDGLIQQSCNTVA